MNYREDRYGKELSVLGYGCMRWPLVNPKDRNSPMDQEQVNRLVDYAIEHLGVKTVVVLGHESCGGVTGAIGDVKADDESKIDELLSMIQADVKPYVGKADSLDAAIKLNASTQVKRINDRELVKKFVEAGKTQVVGAYYNVHDGSVVFE